MPEVENASSFAISKGRHRLARIAGVVGGAVVGLVAMVPTVFLANFLLILFGYTFTALGAGLATVCIFYAVTRNARRRITEWVLANARRGWPTLLGFGLPLIATAIVAGALSNGGEGAFGVCLALGVLLLLVALLIRPTIVEIAPSDDPKTQPSLPDVGKVRDVTHLIAKLQDADPQMRIAAIMALYKLRDSQAVEPLVAALQDPDQNVRLNAQAVLQLLVKDPEIPGQEQIGLALQSYQAKLIQQA